jgi:hypothetical protein
MGDMKSLLGVICMIAASCVVAAPRVSLERAPEGGIQPQIVADANGTIHLLYYKGDAKAGNLFYTRRQNETWGKALRVNDHQAMARQSESMHGGLFLS